MFNFLVKFKNNSQPVLMGGSHSSHGRHFATMKDVEWVIGPIADNGNVLTGDGMSVGYSALGESYLKAIPGSHVNHVCEKVFTGNVTPDNLKHLVSHLRNGEKIQAIKLYRQVTGLGLKESKEFVDALGIYVGYKSYASML